MAYIPRGKGHPEIRKQVMFVRKTFGWSQPQLARELDVSRTTIFNWEHRLVTPDKFVGLDELVRIANQLVRYRRGQPLKIQDDEGKEEKGDLSKGNAEDQLPIFTQNKPVSIDSTNGIGLEET